MLDPETPPARPERGPSTVEQVIAEIRRRIVFGELRPGQEFSLRETAALLKVSTAPVREALRVLQGEGLIVARRARSAVVAPMSLEDLASIYRLRRQVEPDLAMRSVRLLDAAGLGEAELLLATIADPTRNTARIYDAHRDFHLVLMRPAATAWDLRILDTLWQASARYVRVGFGRRDAEPTEPRRREHAHRALLEAFRTGSPPTVELAIRAHLDENEAIARAALPALSVSS